MSASVMSNLSSIPLRKRFQLLREAQGRNQRQVAAEIGVCQASVSAWEGGRKVPRTHHAAAWAVSLGHRLVVTRNRRLIGDLVDVLADLASLRRFLGHSGIDVARRLHLTQVSKAETGAARGRPLDLIAAHRYLAALGCRIELWRCAAYRDERRVA